MALQVILANDLAGRDYPRVLPTTWALALAVNVGLNLWWIPLHGIAGAAAASTIAYGLSFLVVTSYWLRRFRQVPFRRLYFCSPGELRRIPDRLRQAVGASAGTGRDS
jgi:Na+-driven multidrug efflux pump